MNKKLLVFLNVLLSIVVFGCVSTKELDLSALDNAVFYMDKAYLMVSSDVDENKAGEDFISDQFPKMLPLLEEILHRDYGAELQYDSFISDIKNNELEIAFEEIELNSVINQYTWTSKEKHIQNAWIGLPFAPDSEGNIRAIVRLEIEDKENPSNNAERTLFIPLSIN